MIIESTFIKFFANLTERNSYVFLLDLDSTFPYCILEGILYLYILYMIEKEKPSIVKFAISLETHHSRLSFIERKPSKSPKI